jgi:hypothetical protein
MKNLSIVLCILLLASCRSDDSSFRADCGGKKIIFANGVLTVEKEPRRYTFINNSLEGSQCSFERGIIFCYKETIDEGIRTKEQITFDRGYYTLTDIKTTIGIGKDREPIFSKTQIYQANCPMTILAATTK